MSRNYLTVDMTTQGLLMETWSPLRDIYAEMRSQWDHARIGTTYSYFDNSGRLHIHFMERGGYLEATGALDQIPSGSLPGFAMNPVFNHTDTRAAQVGVLLSQVADLDPDDSRWDEVRDVLVDMLGEKSEISP